MGYVVLVNCEKCAHKDVCMNFGIAEVVRQAFKNIVSTMEDSPFDLHISCPDYILMDGGEHNAT